MGLGKTLDELADMPHDEFVGWQAFFHFEPWGCLPADQRAEYQLQLFFSANSKANAEVPRFIERDVRVIAGPEPTPEEIEDSVRSFFAGRTVRRKARKPKRKAEQQAPITNENGGTHG